MPMILMIIFFNKSLAVQEKYINNLATQKKKAPQHNQMGWDQTYKH